MMKGLIILDFNRTLYDPDSCSLSKVALDFLRDYSKVYALALIGNGDEKRYSLIDKLGIKKYFRYVKIKEKKEPADFTECMNKISFINKNSWAIGDRVKKEILISNKAGIRTIWLKNGKFRGELPSMDEENPSFTVKCFEEIRDIIPL